MARSALPLPAYLSADISFDGDPASPTNSFGVNFAESHGRLAEAADAVSAVRTGLDPIDAGTTGYYPALPAFTLRLYLTDPALLLKSHMQRVWRFGALILASVLAAVAGLAAAWRSFRKQLRLNDLKSNFVSSVSHELRAPIASVRLMAESLERGKIIEPGKQREYFRLISQECRRLSSLIENVLDFSRIDQGRKQYEFEPTDLAKLVQQTVQVLEPYAAERGVKLVTESVLASLPAVLDARAIQQAIVNLVDNAIKHSPKGAAVRVGLELNNTTTAREHSIAIWVEDQGEGIPSAEQEKIFERFYRLGSELRRETQGVGIGLSIVKHIVEAHRGSVTVRSQVGQGSRFTILLRANNLAEPPAGGSTASSETNSQAM
jgi:signal transduction histidine kinase